MHLVTRFALGVLLAGLLLSCAAPDFVSPAASLAAVPSPIAVPQPRGLQPGANIGGMTLEQGALLYPFVAEPAYCSPRFIDAHEPGVQSIDCRLPTVPDLNLSFTWGAKDLATLDANWQVMKHRLYVDGMEVDLAAFGTEDFEQKIAPQTNTKSRLWSIHLSHPVPGRHTLRWLWTVDAPLDDGFGIYAPGTYERVVNFTIGIRAKD